MDINPKLLDINDCLYRVSAKAIIIIDHQLLMVLEDEDWYDVPGGGIDYGEDIQLALLRELGEELGIPESSVTVLPEVLFVTNHSIVTALPRLQIYYRVLLTGSDAVERFTSELAYKWVSETELGDLAVSPAVRECYEKLVHLLQES